VGGVTKFTNFLSSTVDVSIVSWYPVTDIPTSYGLFFQKLHKTYV
jgi:hypothetical protein